MTQPELLFDFGAFRLRPAPDTALRAYLDGSRQRIILAHAVAELRELEFFILALQENDANDSRIDPLLRV